MSLLESLVRPAREPAPHVNDVAVPGDAPQASLELKRDFDARRINPIINHPDVLPWISQPGDDVLDLSAVVADFRNVLLMTDSGGLLFIQLEPGTYEVHTSFLPAIRGAPGVAIAKQALRHMFVSTDAMGIVTKVPAHNRGALGLVRAVRMSHEFDRSAQWRTADGVVDVGYWALRYWDWLWHADGLTQAGEMFHQKIGESKSHADDPAHDRVVGAAIEQIFAGQTAKALILYNHWARIAGYAPVSVMSESPLIIDIRDCVLHIDSQQKAVEVIACRPAPQS
jgi:hypothetical protein